ncbi:MAG: AraC family transcriptional regulator, partial [Myxococcales bacterium]|nr:AraC family transcriptional regulator [Myxococcales bacterium]
LQAAFRTFRGTTPLSFLREQRIERARQQLLRGEESTTIARVVHDLGLGSPGRFSADYKRRFGESPSATLARVARAGSEHSNVASAPGAAGA